jgi:dihydrofolate reductase
MRSQYPEIGAVVIGRRLCDLTSGWNGKPAAGERVFVVTHQPPRDREYADTAPFTFAGQIGGQALALGLIDLVVVNLVPAVFGSGRPFFVTGGLTEPPQLGDPATIVRGDRVTHPGLRRPALTQAAIQQPPSRRLAV